MQIEVISENTALLPSYLYTANQTRAIDTLAIERLYDGNGYALMQKAGESIFQLAVKHYSECSRWLVFCGYGNNGGDGYVAAALAVKNGFDVSVIQAGDVHTLSEKLHGEALSAFFDLKKSGVVIESFSEYLQKEHQLTEETLVVDALLGTGLTGNVRGVYVDVINWINNSGANVLSIDVPSGLCSDSGTSLGVTVNSDVTLTFIGINRGLLTGQGKRYTGRLFFDALNLPISLLSEIQSTSSLLKPEHLGLDDYRRTPTDHKGDSGRAAFIGGSDGTSGAAIISCEAALRSGIGLLSAFTGRNAITPVLSRCPEVMISEFSELSHWLGTHGTNLDAIAIGPGLGINECSLDMLIQVLSLKKPTVIDADALNLIALHNDVWAKHGHCECIFTPHPREAARLLKINTEEVESNRFKAVQDLSTKYGITTLLKGSGTLISSSWNNTFVCFSGNSSMAVGGMGDSLAGIILALLAKSKNTLNAACLGAWVHAVSAEQAMPCGGVGLLPTDLSKQVPLVINETVAKRVR